MMQERRPRRFGLQVEAAVKDGFDVRGFFYWTLIDNFEWNFAWVRTLLAWVSQAYPAVSAVFRCPLALHVAGAAVRPVRMDP